MLSAKGRPGVNAKVNLYVAPLAVLSFLIGAQQGGIVGVSIAVAAVLGILWTVYWWWVGCRELGWSLRQFLIPCFIPAAIALLGICVSLSVPAILKPVLFIGFYLVGVRIVAAKQFSKYQSLLDRLLNRLLALRKSK
jgi:O-antigen/teichoic acid export membrane protein